ncbi:MAG: HDOD domain-containing protein [Rhodoferax sp.]
MNFDTLLSARFVMPSAPRVLALLMAELARPQPDLRRIDQLLTLDPALTARIVAAANAPFFKLQGKIFCVAEALSVLRLGQVQAMVSAAAAHSVHRHLHGLDMPTFWAYGRDCARVARALAALLRLNPQAAYTAGLIHALGELALRAALPQALVLDQRQGPLALRRERIERKVLGFSYTQVSAWLCRQWYFPALIVDTLENQFAPFDGEAYEPLAGVLHLAAWRARVRQSGLSESLRTASFPAPVAEVLGLDIDLVLQQDPIDWTAQPGARPTPSARSAPAPAG